MTKDTKNGSKLYFKILKTWKNWESTRITSIPFPFLSTSFPIPSGQIPIPATQIPFSQSNNRSIPVPILPLQDPLITKTTKYVCIYVVILSNHLSNIMTYVATKYLSIDFVKSAEIIYCVFF